MKINVMLDEGAFMPKKAYDADAGFDIFSPVDERVWRHDNVTIDTGVHIEIPKGYVGFLKSKSGLNIKNGITGEGVIDSGYTGSIQCKLSNDSWNTHIINRGDKIIQIVILPIPEVKLQLVDSFAKTERGDNGFGSTGK